MKSDRVGPDERDESMYIESNRLESQERWDEERWSITAVRDGFGNSGCDIQGVYGVTLNIWPDDIVEEMYSVSRWVRLLG